MVEHEETLADALVDHNDRDFGLLLCLVVEVLNCLLELGNFLVQNLFALRISHTVSVDDKVGRIFIAVMLGEFLNGQLD